MKNGYLILMFIISSAYAQDNKIMSRIYFPGLIGTDFQSNKAPVNYSQGILINTGIEYRPDNLVQFFYRFNYDGVTNKYNSMAVNLPTNVNGGSQRRTYLVVGAGYRKRYKNMGMYIAAQPGLGMRSYDIVKNSNTGYLLENFNKKDISIKFTGGFEYYLAPHFALILEPARYQNSFPHRQVSFNNSETAISFGFTTTLF
ncbi:MAG: outer membrane protein beta-barrel protein [Mucilaginibacter sp.]|nr:outer membrane protein beta-barrel protein [Mucilaginibacter sp.]